MVATCLLRRNRISFVAVVTDWFRPLAFGYYPYLNLSGSRERAAITLTYSGVQAAAEGATRSETLRQKDCESGLTLESDRADGPPKGCGQTGCPIIMIKITAIKIILINKATAVRPDLSGNRTEGRQARGACRPFFVLYLLYLRTPTPMGKQTGFYQRHLNGGAKLVDFGGWDMPLHYGSQIDEHHAVRRGAGMFDVSHMTVVDVHGPAARDWLRKLLANDVARLTQPGKGLYSCMLNPAGGVIDDLIVYWQGDDRYRVVVNAATRDADLDWMTRTIADFDAELQERTDLLMLAVQGPEARELAAPLLPAELGDAALALQPFESVERDEVFVARTGYTGEDGWEILLPPDQAEKLWDDLLSVGGNPLWSGRTRYAAA